MNQQKENLEKLIAEFIESASIIMPGVTVSINLQNIMPHDMKEVNDACIPNYTADTETGEISYRLKDFKWLDADMNHALHMSSKRIYPTPVNA